MKNRTGAEMKKVIETRELKKTFHIGSIAVHALRGVDLTVEEGEFISVIGPSGSGKSTLMNLLGCLDIPSSGEYLLDGKRINEIKAGEYAGIRNQKIGFVFQGYNLLPRTSALENVELPLLYDRSRRIKDPSKAAKEALKRVGLEARMHHFPHQLSGGEQQRTAIARALVNRPSIVLADEPTGNLDSVTTLEIMKVFRALNEQDITIILVTHEKEIAETTDRIVEIRDGMIHSDYRVAGNGK